MSTRLPSAPRSPRSASPASGSPTASGSASGSAGTGAQQPDRAARKRALKAHTAQLAKGLRLLPTFYAALRDQAIPRNGKIDVTVAGVTYKIGWAEANDFANTLATQVGALDRTAVNMLKTHRDVKPNAGFSAPIQYSQPIIDFFGSVDLGPQVQGEFETKVGKDNKPDKVVPKKDSLAPVAGSRLNDVLWFTQDTIDGQANPLYGINRPGILTPLYALHAYYTGMPIEGAPKRLSASDDMRRILRDVIVNTIDHDVAMIRDRLTELGRQGEVQGIVALGQQLKGAIDNRAIGIVDGGVDQDGNQIMISLGRTNVEDKKGKAMEIFNPNFFLYAHFSKLNANATVGAGAKLDAAAIQARQAETARVFNPKFGGQLSAVSTFTTNPKGERVENPANAVQAVIEDQKNNAGLARAAKNVVTAAETRRKKAEQKKAAARAGAQ